MDYTLHTYFNFEDDLNVLNLKYKVEWIYLITYRLIP